MVCARWVVVSAVALMFATGNLRAQPAPERDAVALLPLDAGPKLELYGQPVASEIARSLDAGSIDVVVIGSRMPVPERAKLIVDGTIASAKGESVVLTIRVRNPKDGIVLETLSATASKVTNLDRAAAEISGKIVPLLQARLAALRKPVVEPQPPSREVKPPVASRFAVMLVGIGLGRSATSSVEPLRAALAEAVPAWIRDHQREPQAVDVSTLTPPLVSQTVSSAAAERAIAFEVMAFSIASGGPSKDVPLARARVRIRIADAGGVAFDRVVTTDTVVGDRRMPADAVARLVAREVIAIMRPHVRRVVGAWP